MTEEKFNTLKETYVEHIKNYISKTGGLFPHITVFAENLNKEENDKPAIIHIPISDEYMEDDNTKDTFIKDLMPEIMVEIKKDLYLMV